MKIHRMVRTQLYLEEAVHAQLTRLARMQGKTLSELVREALARTYGHGGLGERLATLQAVAGLWSDRRELGGTGPYVRRLRRNTHRSPKRRT